MISHIKDDRSDEDLLFGALLRWGVDITLPIAKRELLGRTIWLVDPPAGGETGAALIACFAKASGGKGGIDTELADALAKLAPLRVLFRDDGFASDAVKENVASRLKQRAPTLRSACCEVARMTVQQFKALPYQAVAAEAVVDCFEGQPRIEGLSYQIDPGRDAAAQGLLLGGEGLRNADLRLSPAQLRTNIRKVQTRQHLTPSDVLVATKAAPINLDIEMETGTGKTYVYIDTMYRLYAAYGWSKFIVVVPSVAIREGVFQTLADTEAHFQELYGHKVRRFIYDSGRPEPIMAFADSPGLHCMIINTQAFASEVKAEGKESKTLRMFREMDQFGSRRPIDLIAANRPILILDEPQRLEGATTQGALARFKAPIALRYSATHRTRHDLVHRLDALDAYNRKLVKRIAVRGVTVKGLPGTNGFLYLSDIRTSADHAPAGAGDDRDSAEGR